MIVRGRYARITLGIYVGAWLVGAFLIIMAFIARSQTNKAVSRPSPSSIRH